MCERVRHRQHGTEYEVLGVAELQIAYPALFTRVWLATCFELKASGIVRLS